MATSKPKTSTPEVTQVQDVERQSALTITAKEKQRQNLTKIYLAEDKVPVRISPFYAAQLGRVVSILVNGIRVQVPADGKTYQVNRTHADEIHAKIARIDNSIQRQKRAGEVGDNFESHPGELQI